MTLGEAMVIEIVGIGIVVAVIRIAYEKYIQHKEQTK